MYVVVEYKRMRVEHNVVLANVRIVTESEKESDKESCATESGFEYN